MAGFALCLSLAIALVERDFGLGIFLVASAFGFTFGLAALVMDRAGMVPSGRLSAQERRALYWLVAVAVVGAMTLLIWGAGSPMAFRFAIAGVAVTAGIGGTFFLVR